MANPTVCLVTDCGKPVAPGRRGMCASHYKRWHRHGDPLGGGTVIGEPMRFFLDVVLAYDGDECLTWPYATTRKGYGAMRVSGRVKRVSRLVCEDANGPPPSPEHDAAHSCGRGHMACVTRRHLSWKTSKENSADMVRHGNSTRGERQWGAKLTEVDVRKIRAINGAITQRDLSEQYGVTQQTISDVRRSRSWGWLPADTAIAGRA